MSLDDLDFLLEEIGSELGEAPIQKSSSLPPRPGGEPSGHSSTRPGYTQSCDPSTPWSPPGRVSNNEIDDLLAEFESVSTGSPDVGTRGSGEGQAGGGVGVSPLTLSNSAALPPPLTGSGGRKGPPGPAGRKVKCSSLVVGGGAMPRGATSGFDERSCDRARCVGCDFRVMEFMDRRWAGDVDYMFLRNTVPDEGKLGAKLVRAPGVAAMCCQCTWESVEQPLRIGINSPIRWVCGGHHL